MTIVDELRILRRLNFLQLTVILLVGLMLWWIVSETIESGAESLLISLLDPDDETTYYWVIRSIVNESHSQCFGRVCWIVGRLRNLLFVQEETIGYRCEGRFFVCVETLLMDSYL